MSLTKLKIESFNNAACTGSALGQINALVNPENYSQDYVIRYADQETMGSPAVTKSFSRVEKFVLSFKRLLVDGTGIIPLTGASDVEDYIAKFRKVVSDYDGTMHQPPFLKVTWGKLIFKGVCVSLKVDYTMFKEDGTALRAFIDIDIESTVDPSAKENEAKRSSPDLSHIRAVKAGDSLPLMTYHIYGDSNYYLKVAKRNQLNSIYDLKPGDQIFFPPLKK